MRLFILEAGKRNIINIWHCFMEKPLDFVPGPVRVTSSNQLPLTRFVYMEGLRTLFRSALPLWSCLLRDHKPSPQRVLHLPCDCLASLLSGCRYKENIGLIMRRRWQRDSKQCRGGALMANRQIWTITTNLTAFVNCGANVTFLFSIHWFSASNPVEEDVYL